MLRIGQKVRIKSWKRMEREYGLAENGNIKVPSSFTKEMAQFCGRIYTIKSIDKRNSRYISYNFLEGGSTRLYYWDEEMLEPLKLRVLIERRKNGNV